MKHYIVSTHAGDFETCAVSERKALSNIRFRLYGRGVPASVSCYWTVTEKKEVA